MSLVDYVLPVYSAIVSTVAVYLAYLRFAESKRAEVFLYRFELGAYWFIQVRCVRGQIENCLAYLDSSQLIIKGTERTPTFGQPLGLDQFALYRMPDPSALGIPPKGRITIKDGNKVLRKADFDKIPEHNPELPLEGKLY
jgi:hypothetical protein